MEFKRFRYTGTEPERPGVEKALREENVSRRAAYLILKYFEIEPEFMSLLDKEFSVLPEQLP